MTRVTLTDEQKDSIRELCEESEYTISACRVSDILDLPEGKIAWFMYSEGLKRQTPAARARPYKKANGVFVRPFSIEEDKFVVEQRVAGHKFREIADMVKEKFGYERNLHSIKVRVVMLAGYDSLNEELAHGG